MDALQKEITGYNLYLYLESSELTNTRLSEFLSEHWEEIERDMKIVQPRDQNQTILRPPAQEALQPYQAPTFHSALQQMYSSTYALTPLSMAQRVPGRGGNLTPDPNCQSQGGQPAW